MRLFVALPVPADVRARLAEATSHARDHSASALRWAPPERWHLTLAFLGDDVAEDVLPDLERRLARAASRHELGTLRLSGAGRFGGRVVWTGVDGDVAGLKALAASVTAAARRAGLA